ncbi:MAG TPA: amidohydrolase family protein [Chloroflexota bacterium]|nr:amidohydrolase family protein [Chloroflexota bacterium]
MPAMPIVDAHLHLWDPQHFRMHWLDGNALLDRTYDLATYREHTAGLDIQGMVYVQVDVDPAYGLLEAQWAVERAREDPRLQAIVAFAPLEHGTRCRSYLQALAAIDRRIAGVRRLVQDEHEPDFSTRADFVRGVQLLPEFGLSCDICIKHWQLGETIRLVRRCPETSFVLDHIGKPDIAGHELEPWRTQIAELAMLPNVWCKVSGLVTEADFQRWTVDDLAPYVGHVLAVFGEDRVLFGGDWPVLLQASTYVRWVEALDTLTSGLSPQARRKLWSDNARRFYRMPQPVQDQTP